MQKISFKHLHIWDYCLGDVRDMEEISRTDKPLWARIIFETPEYTRELLLNGSFPLFRRKIIEISHRVLNFCNKKTSVFPKIYYNIKTLVIYLLEWVNNHWKKGYE